MIDPKIETALAARNLEAKVGYLESSACHYRIFIAEKIQEVENVYKEYTREIFEVEFWINLISSSMKEINISTSCEDPCRLMPLSSKSYRVSCMSFRMKDSFARATSLGVRHFWFVKKKNRSHRMFSDYRELNKHQLKVKEKDIHKATLRNKYGDHEFLVMSFGLATAQLQMNKASALFRRWKLYKMLYGRKCRTPIFGSKLVSVFPEARKWQKSYADRRRSDLDFQVSDRVLLEVSPRKGVIRFRKRGNLGPRYIGPFMVLARVGKVAYRLELPEILGQIHNTFHMSQSRKCLAGGTAHIPLDDMQADESSNYAERPVAVLKRKEKRLQNKEIGTMKVQWQHQKGSEWTYEPEAEMREKYPELFAD
ncbi:hypothetical protein OSB04_006644 [Centaurea solstitialis]|uniref:Tf2-1-like SH3-like domain-containing protein n=1 Tax=Centaurea solstitialis TaxID=347529 RepID=A0AA38WS48_9ASTR|nr:hypothetical protein OSB04_006644 [Centaurea solstitialis]